MDYDIHIGHSGDAVDLLSQILEESDLDQDTRKVLEAIRDAIEQGIV
jgi:predicted peroxiredoxin